MPASRNHPGRNRVSHLSCPLLAIAFLCCGAFANRWEHTSIDFGVLVQALDDSKPNVRRLAAESIGFRQQPGVAH